MLKLLVEQFLVALEQGAIRGKLWIVEPSRIREHEPDAEADMDGLFDA